MCSSRDLCGVEKELTHLALNYMTYFEAVDMKKEQFVRAVQLATQKYAFLRMRIETDSNHRFKFTEISWPSLLDIEINWRRVETIDQFNDWQKRLNIFTTVSYDTSKCLFYIEIDEFENTKYRFYLSINHAGCDTRGGIAIVKDILGNLDLVMNNVQIPEIESKPFLNIHSTFEHHLDLEELKNDKIYECEFSRHINKLDRRETNPGNLELYKLPYFCIFKEFDEATSQQLFQNCKLNGATVQGVLNVIRAIVMINEKVDLSKCDQPLQYVDNVVMDMRYHFGLTPEDVFKAASTVAWPSVLDVNANLWQLAAQTSNEIKSILNQRTGLRLWLKQNHSIPSTKFNVYAGTLGVVSLGENKMERVKIHEFRFMLSVNPELYKADNFDDLDNYTNLFGLTFKNRFLMAFHFSYPSLSLEWGELTATNFYNCLKYFAQHPKQIFLSSLLPNLKRF